MKLMFVNNWNVCPELSVILNVPFRIGNFVTQSIVDFLYIPSVSENISYSNLTLLSAMYSANMVSIAIECCLLCKNIPNASYTINSILALCRSRLNELSNIICIAYLSVIQSNILCDERAYSFADSRPPNDCFSWFDNRYNLLLIYRVYCNITKLPESDVLIDCFRCNQILHIDLLFSLGSIFCMITVENLDM